MMHDMGDWHWGFDFGHRTFGTVFWAIVVLAVSALVKYSFRSK